MSLPRPVQGRTRAYVPVGGTFHLNRSSYWVDLPGTVAAVCCFTETASEQPTPASVPGAQGYVCTDKRAPSLTGSPTTSAALLSSRQRPRAAFAHYPAPPCSAELLRSLPFLLPSQPRRAVSRGYTAQSQALRMAANIALVFEQGVSLYSAGASYRHGPCSRGGLLPARAKEEMASSAPRFAVKYHKRSPVMAPALVFCFTLSTTIRYLTSAPVHVHACMRARARRQPQVPESLLVTVRPQLWHKAQTPCTICNVNEWQVLSYHLEREQTDCRGAHSLLSVLSFRTTGERSTSLSEMQLFGFDKSACDLVEKFFFWWSSCQLNFAVTLSLVASSRGGKRKRNCKTGCAAVGMSMPAGRYRSTNYRQRGNVSCEPDAAPSVLKRFFIFVPNIDS
ncbi:uncharacterized protein [Struthio camelus]|uniref:uncharacterized protein n=1 Tax=Struthio camelus TaxID=8801 RepID=UPI003603B0C0